MAIRGTIIRKFNVRKTIATTKKALAKGYAKVAKEMQKDVKALIGNQTGPSGPPSRPGKPPFRRTGTLQRSVKVTAPQSGIGVVVRSAKHGVYLEGGTSKMAARPFAAAAIKANRAKYGKMLRATVKKFANQKAKKKRRR